MTYVHLHMCGPRATINEVYHYLAITIHMTLRRAWLPPLNQLHRGRRPCFSYRNHRPSFSTESITLQQKISLFIVQHEDLIISFIHR